MGKYLLGIDIGTSACKVAVFERDGKVAASEAEEYPVYYPKDGWAEQNPQDWWLSVCQALKRIFAAGNIAAKDIAGIGIDGQSWAAVAIDKQGNVLTNTPIWMDTRTDAICRYLKEQVSDAEIFEISGNSLQPSYTTAKILWYKEKLPKIYEQIDKILQSNSFIGFRLTGAVTQDRSQGYGLHCFQMDSGTWNDDMCEKLGISRELLPEIYSCDEVIGTVTEEAAKETGLLVGTPVVAGGLDAACGALGAGVIHPGETQEQGGQAGGMSICMDCCKSDPRLIISAHVIPGMWLLQGGTTGGGGVMRWLEKEFGAYERQEAAQRGTSSLALFNEEAEQVDAGSDGVVFLPYMSGERSPIWNPKAKGVFYGLDYGKGKAHFLRAAMEGVAFSLKHNIDIAQETEVEVKELRAMGGSANSLLWTQIKSDITGLPIVVPASDTATTLGAALLAGVGVGMYEDYEEAVQATVRNRRYHVPNPEHREVYDRNYQLYLKLYEQLKENMK